MKILRYFDCYISKPRIPESKGERERERKTYLLWHENGERERKNDQGTLNTEEEIRDEIMF